MYMKEPSVSSELDEAESGPGEGAGKSSANAFWSLSKPKTQVSFGKKEYYTPRKRKCL